MSQQFVLQMAGHPGSGKSLLARGIASATGAVLLDKDVIKSPLVERNVDNDLAAPLGYEILFALGRSIAEQGFSVVLDSPAYYAIIIDRGRSLAKDVGGGYYIIDCFVPDTKELERRLAERRSMPSQISAIEGDPLERPGTQPITHEHLRLETSGDPEACVAKALEYIGWSAQ